MVSAPKLVTPDVYSCTELMVGKECRKKAPVYSYYHSSQGRRQVSEVPQVRIQKGSYLCGGADRTGDLVLTSKVFHAMHVILRLKLEDLQGLGLFIHGRLLKRTLLVVLPVILIQIPICASLRPVPAHC